MKVLLLGIIKRVYSRKLRLLFLFTINKISQLNSYRVLLGLSAVRRLISLD